MASMIKRFRENHLTDRSTVSNIDTWSLFRSRRFFSTTELQCLFQMRLWSEPSNNHNERSSNPRRALFHYKIRRSLHWLHLTQDHAQPAAANQKGERARQQ